MCCIRVLMFLYIYIVWMCGMCSVYVVISGICVYTYVCICVVRVVVHVVLHTCYIYLEVVI